MTLGDEFKSSGITEKTPESILLGAGTIHKNLAFGYILTTEEPKNWDKEYQNYYTKSDSGDSYTAISIPTPWKKDYAYKKGWNFAESLICATSGGSKLAITPELYDIPVDGALVKVKGLTAKVGETATLDINPIELTPDILKTAVIGDESVSETATGYSEIRSRAQISEGDYVTGLGYVGKTLKGRPIIIIFDNALCTSGLSLEGKNKEAAIPAFTFECHADLGPEVDTLPWHIYYPTPAEG